MKVLRCALAVCLVAAGGWLAVPVQAAETSVICTPTGAANFQKRIHLRCSQSFSGISFFAYGSADAPGAARYLSLITSALVAGRNVRIFYDPADLSGSTLGCANGDCRLLRGLEVL